MELRNYWNVIWKRKWLLLAIVGLTIIFSGYLFLKAKTTYQVDVRFITRQQPIEDQSKFVVFTFDRYYNWFSSEFLVDDYTQIVKSDAFARAVLAAVPNGSVTLGKSLDTITDGDIKNAMEVDRSQRELHVAVTGYTKDETVALANAIASVLTDAKFKPISGQMVDDKPVFSQIDAATPDVAKSNRSKDLINAIIRVILGLAAALALVFLMEYLDRSVRDERDARNVLDLPVLGAIPRF